MNLHQAIKAACAVQGIRMHELAARMDVSRSHIYRVGKGNPTLAALRRIADGLRMPMSELFRLGE